MTYQSEGSSLGSRADAEIAALQSEITKLNTNITTLTSQLGEKDATILTYQNRIKELEARIAELEGTQPPPPPPPSTLMGVTVNGGVRKNLPDLHDNVQVSRVFAQGVTNWANEGQHKAFPNSMWACSNSYALSEADLPKMLATIPAADKKKIVAWADGHELEHPDKNLNPADVKARMRRTAPVIRAAGLKVASCVMGFSIKDDEWLKWIDPAVVDIIAFDKYNSGAKKNPPVYQDVVAMVAEAKKQSVRFNKPFAFWETGTNNFGTQAARVQWTKALRAELVKQNAVTAIWFDRPSTSGSDWDATLDRPTAEAWLL